MNLSKLLLIVVLLYGTVQIASAKETDLGILPDNLFYSIDITIEKINLALTFSDEEKISKELEFAKERLSEARLMAEKKNMRALKETEVEHGRLLEDVKARLNDIDGDQSSLRLYVKTEREIEEYRLAAEEEFRRIDLKELRLLTIESDENPTDEQMEQMKMIISNLKGQAGEVKIESNNQKTKLMIKIKNNMGRSDQEIEDEVEKIENEEGLKDLQKERNLRLIADLKDEYKRTISEAMSAGKSIPSSMIDAFNSSHDMVISEYNNGNYGESDELSNEAFLELGRIKEWIEDAHASEEIEGLNQTEGKEHPTE